jgi:mono/diheme cytochrome c family protein
VRAAAGIAVALLLAACGGGDGDGNVGLDEHELVAKGDRLFHGTATCAVCHGADLRGTPMGPSFLEPIYAVSTLPDQAFHDAVRNGVEPKNWDLGTMPALPHVSDADIEAIVAYVRSVQQENGIR